MTTFSTTDGLIRFLPIWRKYIYHFFQSLIDDGIFYAEPRINFVKE